MNTVLSEAKPLWSQRHSLHARTTRPRTLPLVLSVLSACFGDLLGRAVEAGSGEREHAPPRQTGFCRQEEVPGCNREQSLAPSVHTLLQHLVAVGACVQQSCQKNEWHQMASNCTAGSRSASPCAKLRIDSQLPRRHSRSSSCSFFQRTRPRQGLERAPPQRRRDRRSRLQVHETAEGLEGTSSPCDAWTLAHKILACRTLLLILAAHCSS